jgi:cytochrome P450 family 6
MWLLYLLVVILAIYIAGYCYVRHKYSYFADRNVAFIEPKFPLGNFGGAGTKENFTVMFTRMYHEKIAENVKFFGLFMFLTPLLVITDLELIKAVLVKDFQSFHDRGLYVNEKDDPLSAHIFNLAGDRWRNLRAKLTPTFTSGKMKMMFPIIVAVAEEFEKTIRTSMVVDNELDMKDLLARFTTDVIGTCAFGLDCNSLKDPNTEFRRYGKKIVEPKVSFFKQLFTGAFQGLSKKLGLTLIEKDVETFFMQTVRDTIAHRETNNVQRNDFMSLLIQLKNHADPSSRMTIEEIAAQSFVFFFAGFETSSTAMSLALYELAQNQKVQNKARECALKVLERHDGKMTYDAMKEMVYVEQCIKGECFRKESCIDLSSVLPFQSPFGNIRQWEAYSARPPMTTPYQAPTTLCRKEHSF